MARTPRQEIYRATQTYWTTVDGIHQMIKIGELAEANHELVRNHPELWEPVENMVRYKVEQATAAPGEEREVVVVGSRSSSRKRSE
jgi:hypothetical protein